MPVCARCRLQAMLDGLGGAEFPGLGKAHRKRVLAACVRSSSLAPGATSIAVKDLMSGGFLSATPPNSPLLSRAIGDLQLREHVFVPLICPTCQIFGRHCERSEAIQLFATAEGLDCFAALAMTVATSLEAHPPATTRYFAWGCFRYFGCKGV